ncbi:flagellar biosynthesis anti-sigma factor FlgM [Ornithinibacillus gellani]|uniref:flagellar biosynthesis anti-sigma factor FlgM n=1 Tax=Ornithinibacillus gellani TaxID=2293253 RepID=UPI000F49EA5F|nr:flagellar biosynthesis anti-sigma factor FlgM [Ornithinibacillus gellani]TQS74833.1 flagellar biosynthesis anti-sigma factor FlgM [Ornithinibacillus gellani]
MKINGPNQTHFNPYNNQLQKHDRKVSQYKQQDQLEISSEAKELQESEKLHPKREAYLQQLKKDIQTGNYEINYEKTAQKMIDFWSKQ